MHYYKFNIGDYRKDTMHLSPIEHYIYRELIDWYFLDEKPIPNDHKIVLRKLRLGHEFAGQLQSVWDDFFINSGTHWVSSRIEKDLKHYKNRANVNRENGKKGGKKSSCKNNDLNPLGSDSQTNGSQNAPLTNNHKPITNNQEPIEKTNQYQQRTHTIVDKQTGEVMSASGAAVEIFG